MVTVLKGGTGKWFIACIMLYYAIFWFVQRFTLKKIWLVYSANIMLVLIMCYAVGFDKQHSVYMGTFKWYVYFINMLMGAQLGMRRAEQVKLGGAIKSPSLWKTIILLGVSVVVFYGLCWFKHKDGIYDYVQLLSIVPLSACCYYFWQLCNTDLANKFFANKHAGVCIKFIGGMCLEIYMVQRGILDTISDSWNGIFPLNILVLFAIIVVSAYILKCMGKIWAQTFKDGDYDWKEVVKPF